MISVITINLNNAAGLETTIKSLPYDDVDFEHIIVDGGSTDHSLEVIRKHSHPSMKYISEPDSGVYNAMNKGIGLSSGYYLQFLNSGDSLRDKKLFSHVNSVHSGSVVFYGDQIRGKGNRLDRYSRKLRLSNLIFNGGLAHQSQFIPKHLFDLVGLYDEGERIISDWKWNIQAFLYHRIKFQHLGGIICHYEDYGMSSSESELHLTALADQEVFLNELLPQIKDDYKELRILRARLHKFEHSKIFKIANWLFQLKQKFR